MTWKHGFYTDGYESFSRADDAEEAQGAADDIIDIYRENAEGDEWCEDVGYVHYGICLPLGIATQEPIDDELFEDAVDYHLREPEIDAAAFWEVVSKHAPKLAKALAEPLLDCGQDVVCKTPPGCARHWEERNRELVTAAAVDPIAKLEAWRAVNPELREYEVSRGYRFQVDLVDSQKVYILERETLHEAVDAALEASKRGTT